jgi:glycosyltransferase involved in cell wall biosynthesis
MGSVLDQTFEDWELIVIDDGSLDNTREVVEPFAHSDSRIQYHYSENQGAAEARNAGCSLASG